jgi:ATP-dependent Clp protease ATP-binding subunit ClpA
MFERYTEKARRVIFFARYEASSYGSLYIETEHLLLGLLREDKTLASRFLHAHASKESIRKRIEEHTIIREKISTSVDLPLSNESKRVLAYAAVEAEFLSHTFIGTGHLLLGLMREEHGKGAELLRVMGIPSLAEVRKSISESAEQDDIRPGRSSSPLRHSSRLKLVEEESGKKFFVHLPFQAVPRIGEAVLLTGSGEDVGAYRVVDVRWGIHLSSQDDAHVLNEVEIRVKREDKGLSLE